jgi:GWxTD domain-containing protein
MTTRRAAFLVLAFAALGLAACSSADKPALDPVSSDFYRNARLIMTDAEQDIFNHLPDAESRREFITDFWARRNPDPTSEVNEFQQEFDRRVEYADKHFNEGRKGIDTDRGRIYIYLGPPDRVENFPFNQEGSIRATAETIRGPMLWWVYYRYELGIAFADRRNNGVFKMVEVEGSLLEAIDQAKLGAIARGAGGRPVNFRLTYDRTRKTLVLAIPVKDLDFREESGRLKADLGFDFTVYKPGAAKEHFVQSRSFDGSPDDLQRRDEITFEFPCGLPPGKSYVDVILSRDGNQAKARKIFPVKN